MMWHLLFKRVVPAAAIYVAAVHIYVADHILRSGQTKVVPPAATTLSNDTLSKRENLLHAVFTALALHVTPQTMTALTDHAVRVDPPIRFEGIASVENGLSMMAMLLSEGETVKKDVTHTESKIYIDNIQKFTFPTHVQFIPQLTTLELQKDADGNEKIASMIEEWNSKELITHENTPMLYIGRTAAICRRLSGKMLDLFPATRLRSSFRDEL